MPYVTLQQLIDRFGEPALVALTDRGPVALGVIDETAIDRAVADAGAVIDGYLARRYALPLTDVQPLLVKIAGDLVFYDLHTFQPDPKVEAAHKAALAMLRDISAGTVALTAAGIEAPNLGGTGARITDRPPQLTQDNTKGFI
jgi:phage gp36-like protein